MERYIGTKIILAEPMGEPDFVAMMGKPHVDNERPGYKVVYEDGYVSWSPKEVFERSYRRITDAELALLAPEPEAESQ